MRETLHAFSLAVKFGPDRDRRIDASPLKAFLHQKSVVIRLSCATVQVVVTLKEYPAYSHMLLQVQYTLVRGLV